MSHYQKGRKDGRNKQYNPPKRDGILGTSLGESAQSRVRHDSYSKGHSDGDKQRKSSLNPFQRLFD
jgi:hypothetical protein